MELMFDPFGHSGFSRVSPADRISMINSTKVWFCLPPFFVLSCFLFMELYFDVGLAIYLLYAFFCLVAGSVFFMITDNYAEKLWRLISSIIGRTLGERMEYLEVFDRLVVRNNVCYYAGQSFLFGSYLYLSGWASIGLGIGMMHKIALVIFIFIHIIYISINYLKAIDLHNHRLRNTYKYSAITIGIILITLITPYIETT